MHTGNKYILMYATVIHTANKYVLMSVQNTECGKNKVKNSVLIKIFIFVLLWSCTSFLHMSAWQNMKGIN